jgi:hypothetical protein
MRSYDTATATYFASSPGIVARILFWAQARNRLTSAVENVGLWNGAQMRNFTIGGTDRDYYAAAGLKRIEMAMQAGLTVRMSQLILSPVSLEVTNLIRAYDARFAPFEIHRALFTTDTGALVAEPHRVFKGFIDEVQIKTPKEGEEAQVVLSLASTARQLTRTLALMQSDETQRRRSGDRFRRYADVSGSVETPWGEK